MNLTPFIVGGRGCRLTRCNVGPGITPNHLRRLSERPKEGFAHAAAVAEAGFFGDLIEGQAPAFQHLPRRFQAQVFDGFGR